MPNFREQKQISKPGTTARNPQSREMKRKSKGVVVTGAEPRPFPGAGM